MRKLIYLCLFLIVYSFSFSCTKENEDGPKRETVWISLHNDTDDIFCRPPQKLTFIISYRDIQVDATINSNSSGAINALLEDGESINVVVQDLSSNIRANATVNVRTESRPEAMQSDTRAIQYCKNFDLEFINF